MSNALTPIPGQTVNFTSPNFVDKECTVCMPVGINANRDLSFQMLNNEVRQLSTPDLNNVLPNPDFINANNPATEWGFFSGAVWGVDTITQKLVWDLDTVLGYINSGALLQTSIIIPVGETYYYKNSVHFTSGGTAYINNMRVYLQRVTDNMTLFNMEIFEGENTFSYTNNTPNPIEVFISYIIGGTDVSGQMDYNYFGPLTTSPLWTGLPPFLPKSIEAICENGTITNIAPATDYLVMGSHLQVRIDAYTFVNFCCSFRIKIVDKEDNIFISEPLTPVSEVSSCYKGIEIMYANSCDFGLKAAPLEDENWYFSNILPADWAYHNTQYITYLNAYAETVPPEVNNTTHMVKNVDGYITNYEDVITRSELRDRTNIYIPNLNIAQIEQLRLIFMHDTIYVDGQKIVPAGRLTYKKTGRTYEAQIQVEVISQSLLVNNCCC